MKHIFILSCLLLLVAGTTQANADTLFSAEGIATSQNKNYSRYSWQKFLDDDRGLYRVRVTVEQYESGGKTRRKLVSFYYPIDEEEAFRGIKKGAKGPEKESLVNYAESRWKFKREAYLSKDGGSTSGRKRYTAEFRAKGTNEHIKLWSYIPDPKDDWDEADASLDIGERGYLNLFKPQVYDDELYNAKKPQPLRIKESLTSIDRKIIKERLDAMDDDDAYDIIYMEGEGKDWVDDLYDQWEFVPGKQRGQVYSLFGGVDKWLLKEKHVKGSDLKFGKLNENGYTAMYNKEDPKQIIGFFGLIFYENNAQEYGCQALVFSPTDKKDWTFLVKECE